jgi:hypothetical protein
MNPDTWYYGVRCEKCHAQIGVQEDPDKGIGVPITFPDVQTTLSCEVCKHVASYSAATAGRFKSLSKPA